jgi:long-subunit acyl-CoA synthetase (AMP-forming)
MPQPICLAVLSDIGKAIDKKALLNKLEKLLAETNEKLENYKKISTLVVAKEPWTVENGLLTPTLKIKRNQVDQKYLEFCIKWHENQATVIWE